MSEALPGASEAPASELPRDLVGRALSITNESRSVVEFEFGESRLRWSYRAADDDPHGDEGGDDPYTGARLDDGLFLVTFHAAARPTDAVCAFFDFRSGRTTSVVSALDEAGPNATRVEQYVEFGVIDGVPTSGAAPRGDAETGWELRPGIRLRLAARTGPPVATTTVVLSEGRRALDVDFGVDAEAGRPLHRVRSDVLDPAD